MELLTSKTGGAYIPPAKLRMMQESITDKSRYLLIIFFLSTKLRNSLVQYLNQLKYG